MAGFLLINHHVWGFLVLLIKIERWWILATPILVWQSMFHVHYLSKGLPISAKPHEMGLGTYKALGKFSQQSRVGSVPAAHSLGSTTVPGHSDPPGFTKMRSRVSFPLHCLLLSFLTFFRITFYNTCVLFPPLNLSHWGGMEKDSGSWPDPNLLGSLSIAPLCAMLDKFYLLLQIVKQFSPFLAATTEDLSHCIKKPENWSLCARLRDLHSSVDVDIASTSPSASINW